MTKWEKLEDGAVARLAPLVTAGVVVQAMPQTTKEYDTPPVDKPSIIVAYIGDSADANDGILNQMSTSSSAQKAWLQLELTLRSRKLRGDGGIHWLHAQAQRRLHGYKVPGFAKLSVRACTFFAFTESVWVYKLIFMTDTLYVEVPDDELEVFVTEINFDMTVTQITT